MATPSRPPIAPKQSISPQPSPLTPVGEQLVVLYVIAVYMVIIFAVWNVPGVRNLINPLKLFTIGWHELCHIAAAIMTGGTILKVTIDPSLGGATIVQGGNPTITLASGYIGSTLMGGLLILAGWDVLIAKVMSFVLGVGFLTPLVLVRDKLTILLTLIYEALLIGFWFIDHAQALRWCCLFMGVMNIFYVVWDISDDKFFHKTNDSDATQFSLLYPSVKAHIWGAIWICFELCVLVSFVVIGLVAFKLNVDQMNDQASAFLPT